MQASAHLGWLLRAPGVMGFLKGRVQSGAPGPSDEQRANGQSLLWGVVEDGQGKQVQSLLRAPEGYTLTALTSLHIMRKLLAGQVRPGFQTPSSAYGADLIMEIGGVERFDL